MEQETKQMEQEEKTHPSSVHTLTAGERATANNTAYFGTVRRNAHRYVSERMLTGQQPMSSLLHQTYFDFLYAQPVGSLGLCPITNNVQAQQHKMLCELAYELRIVKEEGKQENDCVAECDAAGCHKSFPSPQVAYNCPCCIMAMFCDGRCAAKAGHPGQCFPHPAWAEPTRSIASE